MPAVDDALIECALSALGEMISVELEMEVDSILLIVKEKFFSCNLNAGGIAQW